MNRVPQGALFGKPVAVILASSLLLSTSLPVRAADAGPQDAALKTLAPLEDSQAPAATTAADPSTNPLQFSPADNASLDKAAADTSDAWSTAPHAVAAKGNSSEGTTTAPAALAQADSTTGDGKQISQAMPGTPRTATDPIYRKLPTNWGSVYIRRPFRLFPTNTIIHNLQFRDTPVKEVIATLSTAGHLNIVLDRSALGKITGDLHDLTLNEAMDTVLTSAGLTWRQLDNSTVIVGEQASLARLGLNRPIMRAFKLSYASPFEVANLLFVTVFNKGFVPDFTAGLRSRYSESTAESPQTRTSDSINGQAAAAAAGGGTQQSTHQESNTNSTSTNQTNESGDELTATTHIDIVKTLRGSLRDQTNEGSGFQSAATDPGSETIRSTVAVQTDVQIDQNGGGAIVIPDSRNRQVFVLGTPDDLTVAEEAIRLIDRRPRMIHVQSSLVEIDSTAIRQFGASLNLQGAGASGTVLGGSGAPMINFLPGLGSSGAAQIVNTFANAAGTLTRSLTNNVVGINPIASSFTSTDAAGNTITSTRTSTLSPTTFAGNGFSGFIGNALPATPPAIAGVQAATSALTGFNFLTLSKSAGGRANIATMPAGLNLSLNLALQTGKGKLLANPSVLVEDNTEALVSLSNEVIHKVTTTASLGVISTNVELVKAGIFLDVVPRVAEDGFIIMRLRPQVSTPLGPVQQFANGTVLITLLNVREVLSQEVRVKDGQTLVLGGLFTEQESAALSKVPYLSEAPILGALFRNSLKGRNRTELMLLITPKIVEEPPPNTISESGGPTPAL